MLQADANGPESVWCQLVEYKRSGCSNYMLLDYARKSLRLMIEDRWRTSEPYVLLCMALIILMAETRCEDLEVRDYIKTVKNGRIGRDDARMYIVWAWFESERGNNDKAYKLLLDGAAYAKDQELITGPHGSCKKRGLLRCPTYGHLRASLWCKSNAPCPCLPPPWPCIRRRP